MTSTPADDEQRADGDGSAEGAPGSSARALLRPHGFKRLGLLSFFLGVVLAVARLHFRWAPDVLRTKVFAVSASYLERKSFAVIENNVTEELSGVLVVVGLFVMVAAAEKTEGPQVADLRLRALLLAGYGHGLALLLVILFFYGLSFLQALLVALVSFPLLYLVFFGVLKHRTRSAKPR